MSVDIDEVVRMKGARVQSLWSGYGEIRRVRLADGSTVIVKEVRPPSRPAGDVSHERKCRSYEVERAFYERFASRCDERCRVPALLGSRSGVLVLEDLDAAGFEGRRGRLAPCVVWLAVFHARFLGVPPEGLWETGTYWHLQTRRGELAKTSDETIVRIAPRLDAMLAECTYRTLVHGDAKLANFCFSADAVAAVDFQYVGGGCGVKDLAYLVSGERDEAALVDLYFSTLRGELGSLADAVLRDWRPLYPIACADFYRFLAGWSPSHYDGDPHAKRVVREVAARLR